MAIADFRRISHHDVKISPSGGGEPTPYQPIAITYKFAVYVYRYTLQGGQIHSLPVFHLYPFMYSVVVPLFSRHPFFFPFPARFFFSSFLSSFNLRNFQLSRLYAVKVEALEKAEIEITIYRYLTRRTLDEFT
jgi:hypothetical protein